MYDTGKISAKEKGFNFGRESIVSNSTTTATPKPYS
jgi:hypothetical protein